MFAFEIIFAIIGAIVGLLIDGDAAGAMAGALVGFGFGIVFVWLLSLAMLALARRIVKDVGENPVLRDARRRSTGVREDPEIPHNLARVMIRDKLLRPEPPTLKGEDE